MKEEMIERRMIVNGAALANNIGKPVNIVGTILNTHPNGTSVELKAADNQVVTIKMQEPLQEPLSGLVAFYGSVLGKNTITSDFYLSFPPEYIENFDLEQFNEAITLLNTIPNPWATS